MSSKKYILIILLLVFISNSSKAIFLDIKIYTGYEISSFTFAPISGKYAIYDDGNKIADLYKNSSLTFKIVNNKIQLHKDGKYLGAFSKIHTNGEGFMNVFKINPTEQGINERIYDDNIKISIVDSSLQIINNVELERYVAGVVQSEGGGSYKDIEFYFVQAITCRTYALNNFRKHKKAGFNLCDAIHCQVYYGRCKESDILMATYKTMGKVIVDKDRIMISAAFHSNCGGQTVNSEDIWSIPTSYLKSIGDTFCCSMRNARWEKKILKKDWFDYLKRVYNYPINNSIMIDSVLSFSQEKRKVFLVDTIKLKNLREDLYLRSTFFSIKEKGDTVLFIGKGYGHGVGLCQEGAIKMAELGYKYENIIKFYYKDVSIVNFNELKYLIKSFQDK